MDNEFILQDRLQKIQQIIGQYGEENFYISYSGGKDSNVLHALFDMALPGNRIPRVYCNTGIEYRMVVEFVEEKAAHDDRFVIIKPNVPIKKMLDEHGYPFKSKKHSSNITVFENKGIECKTIQRYLMLDKSVDHYDEKLCCPKILRYQFMNGGGQTDFKISDHCCEYLKVKPMQKWQRENNKKIKVLGLMRSEGGRRAMRAQCLAFKRDKLSAFQPLIPITKEWEEWFIEKYNVELPSLYYPPFNFQRTGCIACPFSITLQKELDKLDEFLPQEKKIAEAIWKPVYAEYRRLGYRLRKVPEDQMMFKGCE